MVDEEGGWLDKLVLPFLSKKPKVKKEPDLAFAAMSALEVDIERTLADHGYTQAFVRVDTHKTILRFAGTNRRSPITVTIQVEEDS
ncbi:hypothetical protein pEaSNUABM11_00222 [Erwinia phage pEa_SNUABM_11]|nr:hypothetical protein pEaSNUABM11_00222 [Erwinia phage pEa_SNUABM_11]